jgi:hypothetical protein
MIAAIALRKANPVRFKVISPDLLLSPGHEPGDNRHYYIVLIELRQMFIWV